MEVEVESENPWTVVVEESEPTVLVKDVVIDAEKGISIRIFRPTTTSTCSSSDGKTETSTRMPITFYLHGGLILSGSSSMFSDKICEHGAISFPALVLHVNYRLGPNHRLPTAFYDVEAAIRWVRKQALDSDGEPWLRELGDFSQCYIVGWSSGGNIAYFSMLHLLGLDLEPVKLCGLILSQPVFGGVKRTRSELQYANDLILPLSMTDQYWKSILPVGADRDHEFCNPMVEGCTTDKIRLLGKCFVRGFGGDVSTDRQKELVEMLLKHGVQVEAHFDEIGFHGIDLVDFRRASITFSMLREFLTD
ncbi:PREDICTED: probable carboxylesterase 9 [Nelumbo nucifera]|uniref:Alpha/beta hydrolase fold-3 domain-containing protein n=2 Tax=Nelumbo nucifera TaxID=4432 RepID=A0A822XBC7_NELNU|nr:PREDICTED: probable carboxylesterase 9 [Nelumbo nucifera]DAD18714.1 TPA_asm: hypothetical protein HUJ06_020177 [Nelumbo nucifera]